MRLHYHTNFSYQVLTEYSAFKSLGKMSQEQGAVAVIIALISEKTKSSEKRKERKRRKNLGFYETLLVELRLEDEQN